MPYPRPRPTPTMTTHNPFMTTMLPGMTPRQHTPQPSPQPAIAGAVPHPWLSAAPWAPRAAPPTSVGPQGGGGRSWFCFSRQASGALAQLQGTAQQRTALQSGTLQAGAPVQHASVPMRWDKARAVSA